MVIMPGEALVVNRVGRPTRCEPRCWALWSKHPLRRHPIRARTDFEGGRMSGHFTCSGACGRSHSLPEGANCPVKQERDFVPTLRVAAVEASPATVSVNLPGTTTAFAAASIYARATGYIAKRQVDIGDRVKAGDLLAQLAVPELDSTDPEAPPLRPERHIPNSIATVRRRLIAILVRRLPRCPCCAASTAKHMRPQTL